MTKDTLCSIKRTHQYTWTIITIGGCGCCGGGGGGGGDGGGGSSGGGGRSGGHIGGSSSSSELQLSIAPFNDPRH